jgi:MFS family permease
MRVGCLGIEAKPFTRTHMHQFTEYLRQFGHFQRNARLFLLIYAPIGIATGVGIVLYPLYLSALGYRTDFIGLQISVGTLSAGLALVPAGFCVDHFGGKAMLFWSGVLLAVGSGIHVLFRDPVLILVGASVLGIGGATLLVLYSPFLARNSTPTERPHLFSLNLVVYLVTIVLGEVLGGALPIFLRAHSWAMLPNVWFLVSSPLARSYQITLLFGLLLSLPAFLPIFFITNDRPANARSEQRRFWFPRKGSRSHQHDSKPTQRDTTGLGFWQRVGKQLFSPLAVLMGANMLIGLGAGALLPYLGLFFVQKLGGNSAQFALIDGAAKALDVFGTLLAPWMVMRIGRVETILLPRGLAIPVLLCIAFFPLLPLVVILYPLRQVLANMANSILQVFSMEVFSPQHRGLSNSGYYGANQAALAVAAPIGGLLIHHLGYTSVFLTTAVCQLLALALFWWRFGGSFVTPETTQAEPREAAEDSQSVEISADNKIS